MSGYWRCPACYGHDGEHAYWCTITEDSDLEWMDEERPVPDDPESGT